MLSLFLLSTVAWAGEYSVIVNAGNNSNASKQDIKMFFLKEKLNWSNGNKVKPYGRSASSKEHKYFLKNILQMTEAQLAQHWLAKKQKTGDTPPRSVGSMKSIIRMVSKYPEAFGVISSSAAKEHADQVKVLFDF